MVMALAITTRKLHIFCQCNKMRHKHVNTILELPQLKANYIHAATPHRAGCKKMISKGLIALTYKSCIQNVSYDKIPNQKSHASCRWRLGVSIREKTNCKYLVLRVCRVIYSVRLTAYILSKTAMSPMKIKRQPVLLDIGFMDVSTYVW